MPTGTVVLMCLVIVAARIADVSLDTIRTIAVIQGRRGLAFVLGFCELLIWVSVVSGVISQVRAQPAYAVAYALGFALGNYVGMAIEHRLALGRQVVRIITRQGSVLVAALREAGLRVTQFDGQGRDGPVQELFIEIERKQVRNIVAQARALDPRCYYLVDDVRLASSAELPRRDPGGWRAILKPK